MKKHAAMVTALGGRVAGGRWSVASEPTPSPLTDSTHISCIFFSVTVPAPDDAHPRFFQIGMIVVVGRNPIIPGAPDLGMPGRSFCIYSFPCFLTVLWYGFINDNLACIESCQCNPFVIKP